MSILIVFVCVCRGFGDERPPDNVYNPKDNAALDSKWGDGGGGTGALLQTTSTHPKTVQVTQQLVSLSNLELPSS